MDLPDCCPSCDSPAMPDPVDPIGAVRFQHKQWCAVVVSRRQQPDFVWEPNPDGVARRRERVVHTRPTGKSADTTRDRRP